MQKKFQFSIYAFGVILFLSSFTKIFSADIDKNNFIKKVFVTAEAQYLQMLSKLNPDMKSYPRSVTSDGKLNTTGINDWTGGFLPGILWYIYEYSRDNTIKQKAIDWTNSLEAFQYNARGHDLGFMMYCSYGNAFRLTNDQRYKEVLIQSAKSLATRYNAKVGSIKSWNQRMFYDKKTMMYFPVIIDNLMNLELLFFAADATGDDYYRQIAIKHAETTLRNHIRPDFSSYHIVNYDPETGEVLNRVTGGGIANNSTWARGQAWGIYGFTFLYRETKDPKFLKAAKGMADFYLNNENLPADKVTYWDFNATQSGFIPPYQLQGQKKDLRDASAAAITCSALFELCTYLDNEGIEYYKSAEQILKSLASSDYLAKVGSNNNFLLKHSVGSFPHNDEMDSPIIYADYYFLEALTRYQKLNWKL